MSGLRVLACFGLPLVLGAALLEALGLHRRSDPLSFLGWAWTAGSIACAMSLFAASWGGLPDPRTLDLALAGLTAVLFVAGRRFRSSVPQETRLPAAGDGAPRLEERAFQAVCVLAVLVVGLRILLGTKEIVFRDDEAGVWAFHAKVLFSANGLTDAYREASRSYLLVHPDYPLLNPLLQLWTYLHFDRITHVANRIPLQLFSLALVLVLGSALRRATRPGIAALLLLAYLGLGYPHSWAKRAHSDVLIALGTLLLLDAHLRRDLRLLPRLNLAALAAALLAWSKHEGKLVLLAFGLAALISRPTLLRRPAELRAILVPRRLAPFLVPAGLLLCNALFNRAFDYGNDLWDGTRSPEGRGLLAVLVNEGFARLAPVGAYFADLLGRQDESGYLRLGFLATCLLVPRTLWRSPLRIATLFLLAVPAGLFVTFLGTPRDLTWHLNTAAARVLFQSVPALFLWTAYALGVLASRRAGPSARKTRSSESVAHPCSCGETGAAP